MEDGYFINRHSQWEWIPPGRSSSVIFAKVSGKFKLDPLSFHLVSWRFHSCVADLSMYCLWLACSLHSSLRLGVKKRTVETLDEIQDGTISVHLKGALLVGTSQKGDAAEELSHVIVQAGGTDVSLNWSKSDAILDELFWWRFPHAGDLRNAQAEVTGQMKFIPVKDLGRGFFPEGTAADTIVRLSLTSR